MEYDAFLREACPPLDLVWRKYRRRAARRRVRERIEDLGLAGYREYLDVLRTNEEEASRFPDRIRLTISRFFREHDRWESLARRGIPHLLEDRSSGAFRAWSAGCCGGEEPYSLALLWLEEIAERYPGRPVSILATDIDGPCLARAAAACYDLASLREVPAALRRKWFHCEAGRCRLAERARKLVTFEKASIPAGGPVRAVDLVLCRYLVFTYYRGARRAAAVHRLWQAVRPGGLLMIGRKEGLTGEDRSFFAPWDEAGGLFRRR